MFGEVKPMPEVVSMLHNPTVEKLKAMKLKTMAQLATDPALKELSFEERLAVMVEKEWLRRKNNRIKRLLRKASFSLNACLEDIDYTHERKIDKKTIQILSGCTFIEQKLNIILSGKTGTGKSFLACALGNRACRYGYTVRYYRMPELLLEIQAAKNDNDYLHLMEALRKVRLLILDDVGLTSYTLEESRDILEIAEGRYNRSSTLLAGQMPHTHWYDLFPDPALADAIMDRLIHNANILPLDSPRSMREVMAEKTLQEIK